VTTSTAPRQRVLTVALLAICLGYFLVILDSTIVNAALPALHRDLRADLAALQWVVDGYLVAFATGLLGGGALGDRLGARRVFLLGLGVFTLSSAACGLAPNAPVLVAARVAQGLGAALAVPTSLSLLRAEYPERGARARAVGVWGAVAGIAAGAGPIVGGLLVGEASWRLVFMVNVPLGLLAIVLTRRQVPTPEPRQGQGFDVTGQLTGALALTGLAYALIEGGHGLSSPVCLAGGLAVLSAAGFVLAQRRATARGSTPMLEMRLLRAGTFSGAALVGLLINLGFFGELFALNLYLQQARHDSPLRAGLVLLPQMGVVALGSWLSGRHTSRAGGPRPTMLIGLGVGAAGLFGLAALLWAGTPGEVTLLVPLVAAGFGMSFTMPAATTAAVDAAPRDRAGLAAGVLNTARQTGSLIGVAVLGALPGGPGTALLAAGAAFGLAAVITVTAV
jgi:DHA2 family methylenomycin A resistance protein-like MFS transporter